MSRRQGEGSTTSLAVLELPADVSERSAVPGAALVVVLATDARHDAWFDAALAVGPLDRESVAAIVDERLGTGADMTTSWTSGGRRRADGPVRLPRGFRSVGDGRARVAHWGGGQGERVVDRCSG